MRTAVVSLLFATLVALPARAGQRYEHADHPPTYYDRFIKTLKRPGDRYDRACLKRLQASAIRYRLLTGVKGVETPVEVLSKRLGGVRYRRHSTHKRRFILDCHLVEVLAALGPRLRRAGVASIYYSSSWRYTRLKGKKELSQHAHGLALDIVAIDGRFGYATVIHHYETGIPGCGSKNHSPKGRAWRRLYCALKHRNAFGRVYTPDTDDDHRDHLHLERPDPSIRLEPRRSSRWLRLGLILGGLALVTLLGVGIALLRSRRKGRAPEPDPPEPTT